MTRIDELLGKMTLEEKVSLLAGIDLWRTPAIERLGIPALKVSDGPVGARGVGGSSGPKSACFPCGSALAATWDTELVERVGQALGEETLAKGAQILLAPTVNLHRSPLAGRNFECYSEDPLLTGKMATAYIRGLQSRGVGACIKHFVCNDSEFERQTLSSDVGERALRELYLLPFEMAIRESQPWSLMSAYNRVNGVYACEHPYLLGQVLRQEWGYDGLVISDWLGTYSAAVPAGELDLEMPGPGRWQAAERVVEMVRSGQVTVEQINAKARRVLQIIERTGLFDDPEPRPEQAIDLPQHRALARQAASQAMVLLKNTLLPLDLDQIDTIAVIGQSARQAQVLGGGSAEVTPHYTVSALTGLSEAVGDRAAVRYAEGVRLERHDPLLDIEWLDEIGGRRGFECSLYDNLDLAGEPVGEWFSERAQIEWVNEYLTGVSPHRFSARLQAWLTPPVTGQYHFSLRGNGRSQLLLDGQVVVDHWTQDSQPDRVPEDGQATPGEIRLEGGRRYRLEIIYAYDGKSPWRRLRVGCEPPVKPGNLRDEAEALAAACDVAIVVAGLTPEWESEGFDRPDLDLPAGQNELIARVAAANPRTVVVLNAGAPVAMPWLEQVAAVLFIWYPGQELGHALADVLLGHVNPSGRLPVSFPKRLEDTPSYLNYPGENGRVLYGEGLFIGYRWYDARKIEPLFPFGYGLSYTWFEITNLRLENTTWAGDTPLRLWVDVQNNGERAGAQVVQVYVRDVHCSLRRPEKELKAFGRVELAPGERQTVEFCLYERDLAFYDDRRMVWASEAGEFELLVGTSSAAIAERAVFNWQGPARTGITGNARLNLALPLRELLAHSGGRQVLEHHIGALLRHPMLEMALEMTLEQVASYVPDELTPEKLALIGADLAAI